VLFRSAGSTWAGDGPGHKEKQSAKVKIVPQTTCPVMGGAINKDLFVDHEGKRVYVCCKGCIDAITKDPKKYIKQLEDKGVTVAKLQETCPVMGGKINKDLFVDHAGKRIYVCCQGCIDAVKKSPAKYIEKLADKGEVPASVPEKPKHGDKKADDAHAGHKGH